MEARNETLQEMIPPVNATHNGVEWIDANGHVPLQNDGLMYASEIDLSGWAMNDFTFGTVRSQYQDPGIYESDTASGKVEVMELISDIPLSNTKLIIAKNGMGVTVPGMLYAGRLDFKAVIYGNYRLYVPNSTLGLTNYLQLISSGSFGSKEPTASSTLYCYRIIRCTGLTTETLNTPALRIGLFGAFYQEGDIDYLMRLKRSYQLQQLED